VLPRARLRAPAETLAKSRVTSQAFECCEERRWLAWLDQQRRALVVENVGNLAEAAGYDRLARRHVLE
jgi:hypothetical protein